FDKEIGLSDGLRPKQADLSCVHALNKPHLHEIHVVLSKHEADQCRVKKNLAPAFFRLCDKMEIEKNIISEFNLQMALWVVKTDELLENYECSDKVIIFIGTRTMNGIGEHEAGFSARDGAAEEGTTVRVEFDDVTTAVDTVGANAVGQSCPHTYGQPLAQFIKATSNVSDAQIISDHPTISIDQPQELYMGARTKSGMIVLVVSWVYYSKFT
ncbi:hypothetical protein Tco_0463134, partial [Tanacetum coccineum]